MFLIDANIFIETLVGEKSAEECRALFRQFDSGKLNGICTHFTVHTVCIFLEKHGMPEKMNEFLKYVMSAENLLVVSTSIEDELKILSVMAETGLDFDDSMQYYVSVARGCKGIVTFDRDFEKAGIATLRPRDVR